MKNPSIIQCAQVFFFTTNASTVPNPVGLIPSHVDSEADVILASLKESFFAVTLPNVGQFNTDRIRQAMQHVWDGLVERGVAEGEMPDIVQGDPHMMLRQPPS
jgi:hypothetical protein